MTPSPEALALFLIQVHRVDHNTYLYTRGCEYGEADNLFAVNEERLARGVGYRNDSLLSFHGRRGYDPEGKDEYDR